MFVDTTGAGSALDNGEPEPDPCVGHGTHALQTSGLAGT
jgi:hypothetical protein